MFKKIIAVLLAVLMITGLVGCGGEKPKDENKGNDKPKTSDTTDAPVETDEPEPTVDPHDVGEKLAEFNPTGTVEETVLFDNEISKILNIPTMRQSSTFQSRTKRTENSTTAVALSGIVSTP